MAQDHQQDTKPSEDNKVASAAGQARGSGQLTSGSWVGLQYSCYGSPKQKAQNRFDGGERRGDLSGQ
jgi:hypothetical protein